MRINNNIAALYTYRRLSLNESAAGKSLGKLSSGLRINKASDDAAGLAVSEKMRAQIRGLNQAYRNAQDGISLIQSAEGALGETHSILQRMRELAIQAANDTATTSDRQEMQKEIDQLAQQITQISNNTEFNTKKLLAGGFGRTQEVRFHTGANQDQTVGLRIGAMDAKSLGVAVDLKTGTMGNATGIKLVEIDSGGAIESGKTYTVTAQKINSGTIINAGTGSARAAQNDLSTTGADHAFNTTFKAGDYYIEAGSGSVSGVKYTIKNAQGTVVSVADNVATNATNTTFQLNGDPTTTLTVKLDGSLSTESRTKVTVADGSHSGAAAGKADTPTLNTFTGDPLTVGDKFSLVTTLGGNGYTKYTLYDKNGNVFGSTEVDTTATSVTLTGQDAYTGRSTKFNISNTSVNQAYELEVDTGGNTFKTAAAESQLNTGTVAVNGTVQSGDYFAHIISDPANAGMYKIELYDSAGSLVGTKDNFSIGQDASVVTIQAGKTASDNISFTVDGGTSASTGTITLDNAVYTNITNNGAAADQISIVFKNNSEFGADAGNGYKVIIDSTGAGAAVIDRNAKTITVKVANAATTADVKTALDAVTDQYGNKVFTTTLAGQTDDTWGNAATAATFNMAGGQSIINNAAKLTVAKSTVNSVGTYTQPLDTTATDYVTNVGITTSGDYFLQAAQNVDGTKVDLRLVDGGGNTVAQALGLTGHDIYDAAYGNQVTFTKDGADMIKLKFTGGAFNATAPAGMTADTAKINTVNGGLSDKVVITAKDGSAIEGSFGNGWGITLVDNAANAGQYTIDWNSKTVSLNINAGTTTSANLETYIEAIKDGSNQQMFDVTLTGNDDTWNDGSLGTLSGGKFELDALYAKVSLNDVKTNGEDTLTFSLKDAASGTELEKVEGIKTAEGVVTFATKGVTLTRDTGVTDNVRATVAVATTESKAAGLSARDEVVESAVAAKGILIDTQTRAEKAITIINEAIDSVATERSKLGALQNRLEYTMNSLDSTSENLTTAESNIRDVDMAKEMMEFTKNNILTQAAQAMLAQANQQPQQVLQLLR